MDKENKLEGSNLENTTINEKYLNMLEELEKDNDLGMMTSINPDQQLDNDDILKAR